MKRILVVGGGLIGARHVRAVQQHPACRLVALVDPDPNIRTVARVTRYSDMSKVTEPVDGVILATPTHLHGEQGVYAAKRGWHMLIEKPVAHSLDAARALHRAVAKAGVASLVGHHRRYHTRVQHLKKLVAQGRIGTPVAVNLIWAMRKPETYFEGNWRTAGGSPVMINLVHDIDLLRFVIGEIAATAALRGADLRGTDRISSGAIALAFDNGATGTISFADTTPTPWGFEAGTGENPNIGTTHQDMLWIMGSEGAVSFPSMTLWRGSDWGTAAQPQSLASGGAEHPPLDAQLSHFLEVMNGARALIDVADATRTLEIALRIEEQLTADGMHSNHVGHALA